MKKLLVILLLLICSLTYGQVVTTRTVKIPNASLPFIDNIPFNTKIINSATSKEYITLMPLSGIKSLSTCILGTEIVENGANSFKYGNDSIGTTSGYVNLARFYSTINSFGTAINSNIGDFEEPLTFSTGLTRVGNVITNNITQYTNAHARASIAFTTGNAAYDGGTGILSIPANISDLTNDLGFISEYIETDPTIYSWAKSLTKPTYTKNEIGLDSVVNHKQWYSGFHPTTTAGYGLPDYPIVTPIDTINLIYKITGDSLHYLRADGSKVLLVNDVLSGTYSPILVYINSIASLTLTKAVYQKVGNIVHVMVSCSYTSSGTSATFSIALPFASTDSSVNLPCGTGSLEAGGSYITAYVYAQPSSNTVKVTWDSSSGSVSGNISVSFDYSIN